MTRQIIIKVSKLLVNWLVEEDEVDLARTMDELSGVFHEPDTDEYTRTGRFITDLTYDVLLLVPCLWLTITLPIVVGIANLIDEILFRVEMRKFRIWAKRHRQ